MNTEKRGGAFLLQEQTPTRLIGSLACTTPDVDPGTIWIGFGDVDPRTSPSADAWEIALSHDVALRLAALLQVLVAQNLWLRTEAVEWPFRPRSQTSFLVEVGRGRHGRVVISWAPGQEGTEWTDDGGHMWKLREDRALDLSYALIATLARNASCDRAGVPA